MQQAPQTISYRLDIQGLRAIAIAIVFLAHAEVPGFAGGFVGVDVFFVLSGYLISRLLLQEQGTTGRIHYGRFLARRLRRLLPALLVMLVVVVILANALLSAYEVRMQTGSFGFSATWTSNFFFALSDFDYFSALPTKDLFLHTWSLGVEEQFYIVWPALIALPYLLLASKTDTSSHRKWLFGTLIVALVVSLALCLHWSLFDPLLGFYMMPARGWQFALGAIVYVCGQDFKVEQRAKPRSAGLSLTNFPSTSIGLALIIGSTILLSPQLSYPSYYALFPSIGAAMVILGGSSEHSSVSRNLLASKAFVWLGDHSYSLYLWHWPVLLFGSAYGIGDSVGGITISLLISTALAMLSYRLIERPWWKGRLSHTTPAHAVLFSVVAISVTLGAGHGLKLALAEEQSANVVLENYRPRLDRSDIYDADRNCDTWYHSSALEPCFIGGDEAKHTAVLLADSIGAQWLPLLRETYAAPDWQFIILTKSACAMVDEEYFYSGIGGPYTVCTTWRESALDYISKTKPDLVFVGSASNYELSADQWRQGSARVLTNLSGIAKNVVLISGTPALSFDGPSCLESPYRFSMRLNDSLRECEERLTDDTTEVVSSYLESAKANLPNVHLLNLAELVCPNGRCAAQTRSGITVFRDQHHLTATFVKAQSAEVRRRLKQLDHSLLPDNH